MKPLKMEDLSPEEQGDLVQYWQTHPAEWIEYFLGATPWGKQREIANAVVAGDRITVASAHDLGKSFISAALVLWYLFSFPQAKVISTSVNFQSVKNILWQEIAVLHRKLSEKLTDAGELFQTELRVGPGWWARGLSSDKPEGFTGYHEEHLMVVVDEACGIQYEVFDVLSTCAAARGNKMLLIGNPTDPNTFFGHTHTGRVPDWTRISMSAYESPNIVLGPDGQYQDIEPLPYPKLVSMRWINEKKHQWGKSDPRFISRVLGRFPESAEDQLISNRYVSQAIARGVALREVYKQMETGQAVISSEQLRQIVRDRKVA